MQQKLFEQLLDKPKSSKKWLFFPISMLIHGLLIAAVVAYPLVSISDQLPEVKLLTVSIAAPALPTVPIGRKGGGGRKKTEKKIKRQETQPLVKNSGRIITPVEIPEEIVEESIKDLAFGPGFGPDIEGAPEGDPYGVIGAPTFLHGDGAGKNQVAQRISPVQKPRLIKKVEPIYPHAALISHTEGRVIIEAVTDIYGKVIKTTLISGHPLLKQAAVAAVEQWIYEPYIIDGNPKPVIFTVCVNFRLQR